MDHENALPRPPHFSLDNDWRQQRFNKPPWTMLYLQHQSDDAFYKRNSVMFNYSQIDVPMYLVAGLYDGYRDYATNIYDGVREAKGGRNAQDMKVVVGPWNHVWPEDGPMGPGYSGLNEAVRWFDTHLKGLDGEEEEDGKVTMFVRDAVPPGRKHVKIPGRWLTTSWPIPSTDHKVFFLAHTPTVSPLSGKLTQDSPTNESHVYRLPYKSTSGTQQGTWFGEALPDMAPYDSHSITFDSELVVEEFSIAGYPKVSLLVGADAQLAHIVVRLEDVFPDGRVSHITGGLRNMAYINSRDSPEPIKVGNWFHVEFDLHVTTWTFRQGHRIRLAASSSVFPMAWPTPFKMNTYLQTGTAFSSVTLPTISIPIDHKPAPFVHLEPRRDAEDLEMEKRDGMEIIR
ncbi:galactose-binding like protein [Gonapodya prolifera JEL478]|uniref:Galactose-binding like protein n=1 Tax=Gonapodya prolifera (strain JEL478) TaxID=1344416 RepID=A0A139AUY7_GONPJ|nr:galactose-binding like protein [Gonapodya prolifera JEL478]|eukprot:KXS20556.1 galactose-binding like protein [Gonapodya prolifera JEL478]